LDAVIITRQRKHEAEQAIEDLIKKGFEVTFPLTEFSSDGKIFDRDSFNRKVFVQNTQNTCWKAKLRKVD
jgi:hypothetical protein